MPEEELVCTQCGKTGWDMYEHRAKCYEGWYFCKACARRNQKAKPSGVKRFRNLLRRLSRDRLMTPSDITNLQHKVARKFMFHLTDEDEFTHGFGYYRGAPLLDTASCDPERVWALRKMWQDARGTLLQGVELEIAILLSMVGDHNAVKHSHASKYSDKFWGRKATNTRNYLKH